MNDQYDEVALALLGGMRDCQECGANPEEVASALRLAEAKGRELAKEEAKEEYMRNTMS